MKNIFNIIRLSKPQHALIAVSGFLILIQAMLNQATPVALKFLVDGLTAHIATGQGQYGELLFLFLLILAINVIAIFLNAVSQRLGDFIASRLGRYLTEMYYQKMFTLPQRYFDSEISGKMVNQLNRGIISIQSFIGTATNFILPALSQALFGIAILAYFDWRIAALAASVFPAYIAISSYSTARWGKIQEQKNVHEDASRGRIQEVISNIKLVRIFNTQQREWKYVSDEYATINRLYDTQSNSYHVLNFLREFGLEIAFVGILFLVFQNTFAGVLSLGTMVLIIQLLNQLRRPLYGMSYILEQVRRAEADSKAFFEVLQLQGTEKYQTKQLLDIEEHPALTFHNVSFSYQEGGSRQSDVLKNLTFSLDTKETVALVGHSGAGKTTLVNLILKLYEPTEGEITLSGKKYSNLHHAWIRNQIALVFQDNELFSSTIRENVAYGVPKATDEQIWRALTQANATDFVKKLSNGLDSKIGERGVKLSGGQKQRIQIARAILHNKPILILDEATSSLDSKSERQVQDALEKLFKNRLVLIIAHRFSTIQNVDRIIVLDKGTIADSGKPVDLANRTGVYAELLKYQIEGNKKLLSKYEIY